MMLETLLYIVFFLIVLPLIGLIILAAIQSTPHGKPKVNQAEIDRQIQGIPAAVRVGIEQEKMPSEELKLLHNSLFTLGGIETDISEIVQNGIWGISDPMYGLYRKNLKQAQQMPKGLAIDTIKNLYSKYPWTAHWAISGLIKSFEESKQPQLKNAAIAFRSVLTSVSITCSSCKNSVPKQTTRCPYCGNTSKPSSNYIYLLG